MAQTALSPATGTNKELLQRRYDEIEHRYREAAEKADHLGAQVRAEKKAIDDLNAQYETACRRFASGEEAQIAPIIAEKDRRGDRLRGLEALFNEAAEAIKPLHDENVVAARALQEEVDRLELARLEAAIADANRQIDAAQAALNEARKVGNAAVYERTKFLRHLELKANGRA